MKCEQCKADYKNREAKYTITNTAGTAHYCKQHTLGFIEQLIEGEVNFEVKAL